MRHLTLASFFLLTFACVSGAYAADKTKVQDKAAKKACLAGDYAKGVSILSDLYADTNDPNYIFNGGRCFEQNGRYEEAILRFREYLRKANGLDESDKSEARKHIADCESLMGKKEADVVAPPVQADKAAPVREPSPEPKAPVSAAGADVGSAESRVAKSASDADRGAGLRIGGATVLVVGAAALASGIIFNVKANSLANELESTTSNYQRTTENRRKDYVTYGWASYGVGGACVIGGAIIYLLGRSQGVGETSQVALLPSFRSGEVGAVLEGAF
jgi:tetratricopeptide (TPR) repeat protein